MNTDCCTPKSEVNTDPANGSCTPSRTARKPRYDVSSSNDAYTVTVEVPGVSKEDVSLRVEEGVLTVDAKTKARTPESWKSLHRELAVADYQLRLRLNAKIDEQAIGAALTDGVLTLTLPVREAAKTRQIEIR